MLTIAMLLESEFPTEIRWGAKDGLRLQGIQGLFYF